MLSGLLAPPSRTVRDVTAEKRSGLRGVEGCLSRWSRRLASSSGSIVAHFWPRITIRRTKRKYHTGIIATALGAKPALFTIRANAPRRSPRSSRR